MAWFYGSRSSQEGKGVNAQATDPSEGISISGRVRQMMLAQERSVATSDGAVSSWVHPQVVQAPFGTTDQDRFGFGPADNAANINALGGRGSILPLSMLRRVNVAPFTAQAMRDSELSLDGFILASGLCSMRVRNGRQRRQLLMMETLVPFLPEDQALSEKDARKEVYRILSDAAVLGDQAWFVEAYSAALKSAEQEEDQAKKVILANWKKADSKWADGVDLPEQLRLMDLVVKYIPDQGRTRCLYTILLCLISFALRGEVSNQKLARLQTDLSTMMPGIAEQLSREDIAMTWKNFGHLIDDTTAGEVFNRWLQSIPAPIIRVRVCIAQAAGSGLTSLDIIAKAIKDHPKFPWYIYIRLYPEEWSNAIKAIKLVGTNPYYGYRGDLSEVRSTRYKSLSWACWRLLVEAGDVRLAEYKGVVADGKHREQIDSLIRGYFQCQQGGDFASEPTVDEVASLPEVINLVATYPANTGSLISMTGHTPEGQGHGSGAAGRSGTS